MEVARITAVVTANTSGFLRGMAQVDAGVKRASAQMAGMTGAVAAASGRMATLGSTISRRVTLPVLALGGAAVAMSMDFETSMAKVQGLVGIAENDVKRMSAQVKQMGPAYGKSASEAADALFYITSAGLRGKDAIDVLDASMKASVVGLGDTATVADLATSAMNAYGSSVLPATKATDVMVTAVREGKLEASELAGSMGRVLPIASAMGVSFDQVGAAFAALSRTGTNAAEAATQIRGILSSLLRPTKMASDTLSQYGLSAGDLRKQIREKGLLSVLQTLTKTFGDNEEAQAKVFGNIRALSGVMDLMGANSKTTAQIFNSLKDSTDATNKAFAVMEKTTAYKLSKAFEQAKSALMEFGGAIAPVVGAVASAFAKIFGAISNLPGPIKNFTAAALGLAAVLGPLLLIAGKLGMAFTGAARGVAAFGAASGAAAAGAAALGPASGIAAMGMANTGKAAGGAAGKVGLMARMLPMLATPLGAVTAAVGIGITALFAFRNELSHGERAIQGVAQRQEEFKSSVAAVGAAFTASGQAVRQATALRNADAQAQAKSTAAQRTYLAALLSGQKANETEAQFLTRIAGLRRAAASAEAAGASARATSNAGIRTLVDNTSKLADAGNKELETARRRAETSKQATSYMALAGKSESERTKILNESEMAQADLAVVEARRVSRLQALKTQQQAAIKAVENSKLSDQEKTATLAKLNGALDNTNSELQTLKGRSKQDIKITAKTSDAETKIAAIKLALGGIDRMVTVTVKAIKEGFNFGGIAGYASGGVVRGPNGTDVIPAMLTKGEAVLTEKQQALVNSGMTVGEAFRRTGVPGFKGGGWAAGFRKKRKGETDKEYNKAKNEYAKKKRDEAQERARGAGTRVVDTIGQQLGGMLSAKYTGGFTGPGGTGFTIGKIEELRRAQESTLKSLEANFSGTVKIFGQDWSGGFAAFDEMQRKSTRDWERTWKGTVQVNGQVFTGGMADLEKSYSDALKGLDKKFDDSRKQIEATFDALTPAEAALKALNDQAKAADLAANISDAQKALEDARAFGSAKQIKDAEKALAQARLDEQRAGLESQAQSERDEAEKKKQAALEGLAAQQEAERATLESGYALARQQLQDQFDDARVLREAEFARQRAELQTQLEAQLQSQRDADAQALAQLALQQQNEQAMLDDRLAGIRNHFENLNGLSKAQSSRIVKTLREFDDNFRYTGNIMMDSLVTGIMQRAGRIRGAANAVAKILQDYLKLNSPAKKGPLSDLNHWFDALGPTLASGVDASAIERELGAIGPGGIRSGGSAKSVTINLNVSDQTFAGMSREQADRVARDIQAAIDRQVRITI